MSLKMLLEQRKMFQQHFSGSCILKKAVYWSHFIVYKPFFTTGSVIVGIADILFGL